MAGSYFPLVTDPYFPTRYFPGTYPYFPGPDSGTPPVAGNLRWYLWVDWENNGSPTDEYQRLQGLTVERGRKKMIKADGSGLEPLQVGIANLTLDNYDGRFDPLNTSSPLYGNIGPGLDVYIQVNDGISTYNIMRGMIDDIIPIGGRRNGQVRLTVKDGLEFLRQQDNLTYPMTENMQTGRAIDRILTQAAWPSGWGESIQVGSSQARYWWIENVRADEAIHNLNEYELGVWYIAANGQATFRARSSNYYGSAVADIDQSLLLTDVILPQPWHSIRNVIHVRYYPPTVYEDVVLWTLTGQEALGPGETITFIVDYKYENRPVAGINTITPVSGTDYTFNTAPDDGGTDLSASLGVSFTDGGDRATVIITNNHGSLAGFVNLLQIRGDAVDFPEGQVVQDQDSTSKNNYGRRTLVLDQRWQQNRYAASDMANYTTEWLKDPLAYPVVQVEARSTVQFPRDLFDRINLDVDALGIDADYYIGGIIHEWLFQTGQGVRTTWYLEPVNADTANYWIFPATFGTNTVFGY